MDWSCEAFVLFFWQIWDLWGCLSASFWHLFGAVGTSFTRKIVRSPWDLIFKLFTSSMLPSLWPPVYLPGCLPLLLPCLPWSHVSAVARVSAYNLKRKPRRLTFFAALVSCLPWHSGPALARTRANNHGSMLPTSTASSLLLSNS